MKKKIKSSKLIIVSVFFVILALAVIVAGGTIFINNIQSSLWEYVISDIYEVTSVGRQAFDTFVRKDKDTLHAETLTFTQMRSDDVDAILNELSAMSETYSDYLLIIPDQSLFYVNRSNEPIELSEAELETYADLGESGPREPFISTYTGRRRFAYYERFTFSDGVSALIQKEQPLTTVGQEYSLSFYGDQGFSYIVKDDGTILIRPYQRNSNHTFQSLFDIIDLDGNDPEILEEFQQAIAQRKSGVARFLYNDEDYIYSYVPVETTEHWYFVSIIPSNAIMEHLDEILQSSQVFFGTIIIALLVFASFLVIVWQTRKRVREKDVEIQYREQLFNILANNTDDVFIMLTTDTHQVEYVSPNVERVLGIPRKNIMENIESLGQSTNDDTPAFEYSMVADLKPGESYTREGERIHRITGDRRWYLESVYRAAVDDTEKFILTISDRTKDRKTQQTLSEALDAAEVANRSKSTFLSNISHDIRTPMNAIVGLSTLLQRDAESAEKVREHTRKITASSQHLLGLLNDVLDMSKIESGKTTLNISELNLAEIVGEMDTIIRPQARSKQQTFEITTNSIIHEHLLGDHLRINQILINVLGNAVKYTQPGGQIDMLVEELPQGVKNFSRVRFIIKDNGYGMSEEFQKTIFQAFTREVNSTTSKIQGTGLGMAITKNLVDLMGGTISVKSKPNEGSTFTVDLELRIPDREVDLKFWEKHGVSRILVVDDDLDTCKNILNSMADTGLAMEYATGGVSAVKMALDAYNEGNGFDLILLDWKMPDLDGIDTARAIRKELPQNIPIMILTSADWTEVEDEAREAGVDGFLAKPFFLTNFMVTMEKIRRSDSLPEDLNSILKGKHILAAEDNELNSEILTELLDMAEATCEIAENGQIALEKFKVSVPGHYDLILMDVQMPVMNGYEATRAIRSCSHPLAKTIPIIAMTANAFAEDVKAALDSGMDAHIAKPVDIDQLETAIWNVLQSRAEGKEDK